MMKRVNLSRFHPLEVSRKVQQCLRFEGVVANGVTSADGEFITDVEEPIESKVLPVDENSLTDECSDQRIKGNILSTIKKKWKKSKRNKRCDGRNRTETVSNMCQCYQENCDFHDCCSKQYKIRKHKSDKNDVWPVPSTVLRCQNRQHSEKETDDVAELITSVAEEQDECTCFGLPCKNPDITQDRNATASGSRLVSRPSSSFSDISRNATGVASSLALTVEPEGGSRFARLGHSSLVSTNTYASALNRLSENVQSDQIVSNSLPVIPRVGNLIQELEKLSRYGWYWGPINRSEAESKLLDQPDGAFLVRDSLDDRYILSLSFRSCGKTLHTRIEHSSGLFSFYSQQEHEGHASIVELIQQSMCFSQSGVFCYSRSRSPGSPSFPVRLTKPISRFTQVKSLQYLCRFIIRQYTRYDHIQKLPLPQRIKGYLEEGHY